MEMSANLDTSIKFQPLFGTELFEIELVTNNKMSHFAISYSQLTLFWMLLLSEMDYFRHLIIISYRVDIIEI